MKFFAHCIDAILAKKIAFLSVFFVIFTFSYGVLFMFDMLPEPPAEKANTEEMSPTAVEATSSPTVTQPEVPEPPMMNDPMPSLIRIPSLDRTVAVLNPASRTVADLDAALLDGVVRHPDSATLTEEGNIFILGHSSYLPNVINKNFQALNGVQNLEWGDEIILESSDGVYTYQVKKVYKAKVSTTSVPIAVAGNRLTLATCNSFGSVDDRYIVEAELRVKEPKTEVAAR
jgi:LPXTG-site transpeptidase (sortase) family protein